VAAEDETESKSDREVTMKSYSKIRVGETPLTLLRMEMETQQTMENEYKLTEYRRQ